MVVNIALVYSRYSMYSTYLYPGVWVVDMWVDRRDKVYSYTYTYIRMWYRLDIRTYKHMGSPDRLHCLKDESIKKYVGKNDILYWTTYVRMCTNCINCLHQDTTIIIYIHI